MEQFTILPEQQQANTAILPDNSQLVESIFRAGAQRFAQNEYKYQKHKEELADKLGKIDVDTSTAWEPDVPEVMGYTNNYLDFVSQNPQSVEPTNLQDPEQMKLWKKYEQLKQLPKQASTTSNAQKIFYYQQKKLIQDKPELYDTPDNQKMLEDYKNAKIGDRQPFDLKQKIPLNYLDEATKVYAGIQDATSDAGTTGNQTKKISQTPIDLLANSYSSIFQGSHYTELYPEIVKGITAAKNGTGINPDIPIYDFSTYKKGEDFKPVKMIKESNATPEQVYIGNTLSHGYKYDEDLQGSPTTNVNVNTGDLNKKDETVKTFIDNTFHIIADAGYKDKTAYNAKLGAYKVNTAIPNIDKITWDANGKTYKGNYLFVKNDPDNLNNSIIYVSDDEKGTHTRAFNAQNFLQNMLTANSANVSSATQLFLDANGNGDSTYDLYKWAKKYGLDMEYLTTPSKPINYDSDPFKIIYGDKGGVVTKYGASTQGGGGKTYKGLDKDGNPIYE